MARIAQSSMPLSFLLPMGEKAGPAAKRWEDEGEQVLHGQYLIPLTFPLLKQWAPSSPPWGEENRKSGVQAGGGN
jgi:Na+-translocating ferredoxin:NAD+ oxidoreductase RnfC subunit